MTWLLAVGFRPIGAFLLFGGAALIAWVLSPLFPPRWRAVLYDRSIKKRNPWTFGISGLVACYGTLGLVAYLVWVP
jgi:hypothetical protein